MGMIGDIIVAIIIIATLKISLIFGIYCTWEYFEDSKGNRDSFFLSLGILLLIIFTIVLIATCYTLMTI